MKTQNISNYQSFKGTRVIIHSDLDFVSRLHDAAKAASKRLENEGTGKNIIDFDMIIPLNDVTILARKEPKTFFQKLLFALGLDKKAKDLLPETATENDIYKASIKALKNLDKEA